MKKVIVLSLVMALALVCSFALIGCQDHGEATSITNLTYNGEQIMWDSVKFANNYKIKINGQEFVVGQKVGKVAYNYDSKGEDFEFSIEAVTANPKDQNPTYALTFTNIGKVEGVQVEGNILKWNTHESAESYEVMCNTKIERVTTTTFPLPEGEFNCKVRAIKGAVESADGNIPYFSIWSESIQGTILTKPENIKYDSEVFTWDKVVGASSYIVKIDNEEFTTDANRYEYAAGDKDFNISISAVGDANRKIYNSAFTDVLEYKYIAPIEGINVVDGKVKWTASKNAVRYKIKVNGIVENEPLTTNEYDKIASDKSYRIQILPVGQSDFWFSRWSEEMTINILRSPTIKYSDGNIMWQEVPGASGYEIKIMNGSTVLYTETVGAETFVSKYAFDKEGQYDVYVKANALGTDGVYGSKYSVSYPVRRLGTPTNHQVTNRPLEQNQVSVSFTPCVGAESYSLLADGVEIATTTTKNTTFSLDLTKMLNRATEGVVNMKIVAKGGVTSKGAVLDSNVPLEFNVTKLATPANVIINGTQIEWDSVNKTSKYIVTIDGKRTEVTTTSYTLTDVAPGTHSVYVQAMGNSAEIITGSFSNKLDITKLATPNNLVIKNGNLTWDIVPHATAYKVILGTEQYNANLNAFNILGYTNNITEGQGAQISVFAIGNGSDVINSNVSTTRTISKYQRPSAVKVNGDVLVWNASSVNSINCNSYKLIIGNEDGTSEEKIITGTSYAMKNFKPGTYNVKVIARGDMVQTIDSPESNVYTFTKLASVATVNNDGTSYTWDAVPEATGYEIKLSKDATWTSITEPTYTPTFNTEGDFEVSVRAIGDQGTIINSEITSFTQVVRRMTQLEKDDTLTKANAFKVEKVGNEIVVNVKKQAGAVDYKLFISGMDRSDNKADKGDTVEFRYTMTTSGVGYTVQVQVVANKFDGATYKLDSNKSTEVIINN